jgi:peptide chain release factor 1
LRLPQARLDQVLDRFREIEARMGAASDGAEIVRLSKEHAELKPVVEAVQALERARAEAPELEEMASAGDPEMAALAREELDALKARLPDLERDVALLLAPTDIFPNCPRYLPRMQVLEPSVYVPQADEAPVEPKWKSFEMFADVVPPRARS